MPVDGMQVLLLLGAIAVSVCVLAARRFGRRRLAARATVSPVAPAPQAFESPSDRLLLAPGVELPLVCVPGGEFVMGEDRAHDPDAGADQAPRHSVHLDTYWIGRHPVTVAQFAAFVQATGYRTSAEQSGSGHIFELPGSGWREAEGANWKKPYGAESPIGPRPDHPVTQVSWHDAAAFCAWASQVTGRTVKLPSEAQWEKAVRGTDGRRYPWGDEAHDVARWNTGMTVGDTTPVGAYSPRGDSPYGCVDMLGNVWEWCADWYDAGYYARSPQRNPAGPEAGAWRVLRGGSYFHPLPGGLSCATRNWDKPGYPFANNGFRVVVTDAQR